MKRTAFRQSKDLEDDEEESALDAETRIEYLEGQITALKKEKERLSRLVASQPMWSDVLLAVPVVLRGALWAAAGLGILCMLLFVGFFLLLLGGMQPR
ncbi:MAG: hypothetical protein U0441_13370 [Polyangiaceae bacterium]